MRHTIRRWGAVGAGALVLAAGGGLLAGCGDSGSSGGTTTAASADTTAQAPNGVESLPATEILSKSLAAAQAASSVTVTGDITSSGQSVSLDLQLGEDAANGSMQIQGAKVQIRMTGGKVYLKLSGEDLALMLGKSGNAAAVKAAGALIGDKWLLVPAGSSNSLGSLGNFAQKDDLLKQLLTPNGTVTVTGTGEAAGVPVVLLQGSDRDGTLAIQTVGQPYPVQVKGNGKKASGQIDFTDWNAPVDVTAPTDVLDVGALAQLGGSN